MPYRKTPIAINEVYHVFNRSVAQQPIFITSRNYQRAIDVFTYYLYSNPPLRFSLYNHLPKEQRISLFNELTKTHDPLVQILCFCLMPNHIHFLLKNLKENGISTFMRKFQDSYAKYFNTKSNRTGSLFQHMFKAVRIETDEQLVHVSRYIHLNPTTAYLVEIEKLKSYSWSSYPYYVNGISPMYLYKELVLNFFKSVKDYEQFVLDRADYQRELDGIKHLILEQYPSV